MKQRFCITLFCLLTCLVAARPASARSVEEALSDTYIRQAVAILGYAQVSESDAPYVITEILLDAAIQLNPDNAQAWAMRAELAQTTGDTEGYEEAMVGYLATGVTDDRASYALITSRLAGINTLDGRLSELVRILEGPDSRSMTPTLRSRLASLASSMASELLDEPARRRWAVEAARSDPGNLAAAQGMLDLVIELNGNTVRRGTATVNVIRANPLDPEMRLQLASLLAQEAAYARAAQQYQVVATRLSQQPLPMSAYITWAQCLAMTGEDEVALQLLDQFEQALNQPPADAEGNEPPVEVAPVPLPIGLALVRLAVQDGEGEEQAALQVFNQIVAQLSAEAPAAEGEQEEDTTQDNSLALIAAVFCPDIDRAEAVVDAQEADPVAQGWIALRRGDTERAGQLFGPHANDQPLAACGMALVTGVDNASRARLLQEVVHESPNSMAALIAGRTLLKLRTQAQATDDGQTLLSLMARYPESFWLVDLERTAWLNARIEIDPKRVEANQPVQAEITLWNTTRFPLAIGETGPIQPQAVVTVTATHAGQPIAPFPPMVIDLGRTYTLAAGERLIVDTQLDYHEFGSIIANNPGVSFIFDVRLVVNPFVTPGGNWLPNGIGEVSEVRSCFIQDAIATPQQIETWLGDIDSANTNDKMQALRRLSGLSAAIQPNLVTPELLNHVRPVLLQAWDNGTPVERAWMIYGAVMLEDAATSFPELRERAMRSDSQEVWLALLVKHAQESDSELLRMGVASEMPEVSRFAQRLRRLLREMEQNAEQQGAE